MSNKYAVLNSRQVREKSKNQLYIKHVKEYTKKISESLLMYMDLNESNGKLVYFNDSIRFLPQIIEGRNFNDRDFENNTNTILLNEKLKSEIILIDGKRYYSYDGNLYEVIGIFTNEANFINATNFYINMFSSYILDNLVSGTYYIDAKESSMKIAKGLIETYEVDKNGLTDFDISISVEHEKSNFLEVLNINIVIELCVLFSTIIAVLNTYNSTRIWINGKKKEIGVRLLVGSTKFKILRLLFLEYIMLISCSFAIGILISNIIISLEVIPLMKGVEYVQGVLIAYGICLFIGVLTGIINITICFRKSIVSIL